MTKGIFVTATGTDVGKTYVSALLVKMIRQADVNCGYYKPALSGVEIKNGKLVPGDCDYVLKTSGLEISPDECVSYMFKPAVSPHLAAKMENNSIKLDKILNDFSRFKQRFDYIVVEGAGGIVCPFNIEDNLLLPDVIKALNLDIIVVASAELGTINSTFLTVEYARQRGINVRGIILNNYNPDDIMQADNKKSVEILTGIPVIATVQKNQKDLDISIETLKSIFKEV